MAKSAPAFPVLKPFDLTDVKLQGWHVFAHRFGVNKNYVMSLKNECLLQNFELEAGLKNGMFRMTPFVGATDNGDGWHWGWESPENQLRGHFPGHWLSAAARIYAITGEAEVKQRVDRFVEGLARCQGRNGGEWAGSIPEKYFHFLAKGAPTWAPHYVVHKMFMGLIDAHRHAGSSQALEVAVNWAKWFHRWTDSMSREQLDRMLDCETGGMMEVWADLLGITGKEEHRDLMLRYERRRLFNALLAGEDPMTNIHANTTVPEAHGAARAYEVTGEKRWRQIVEAYWKCAVSIRGCFCTGGQTTGEVWNPPHQFASRLGHKTQEHCVVYNMIRLADFLFRWTGDVAYSDYIERNLYNGILAQQHPGTGMNTYWLGLQPGAQKVWGSPTNDFWCCYGTLVQAHTLYNSLTFYHTDKEFTVSQYIPAATTWKRPGGDVAVSMNWQTESYQYNDKTLWGGAVHRPNRMLVEIAVKADKPADFTLKLRLPEWLAGKAALTVNGKSHPIASKASSFVSIKRTWSDDKLTLSLPRGLWTDPIPDEPDTVAFMDGPVVLAGLVDEQRTLIGDKARPEGILAPDNEREWGSWLPAYRTVGQDRNFRLLPIHEVVDQKYTVYFPVRKK